MENSLKETFGNIDIYLFDQLLKETYDKCTTVLDAGCGNGRNIIYFLKSGYQVYGIDQAINAIEAVKQLSQQLAPSNSIENFRVGLVEELPFDNNFFDLIICSAVLHFASNKAHFDNMIRSIWRVLKPGGYLFARLASNIGIEHLVKDLGNGRYYLPDGSERFLVSEQTLIDYTNRLGGELHEYIKTTNVQNQRCMTTWCLQKK
jgi:SAM-dependent methyltransferase